jgi:hypothetical protein
MLDRRGLSLRNNFAGLYWQTFVAARIEAKGFFGALANQQH